MTSKFALFWSSEAIVYGPCSLEVLCSYDNLCSINLSVFMRARLSLILHQFSIPSPPWGCICPMALVTLSCTRIWDGAQNIPVAFGFPLNLLPIYFFTSVFLLFCPPMFPCCPLPLCSCFLGKEEDFNSKNKTQQTTKKTTCCLKALAPLQRKSVLLRLLFWLRA